MGAAASRRVGRGVCLVNTTGHEKRRKVYLLYVLVLCIVGLLINMLGARLAHVLHLPLYLDNIGSALTAALGGYMPGILVGFFTNLVNGIFDYTTVYYGSLTVLIAICSAFFAKRKFYDKPQYLPLIILVFALIGGGLGSVLTWVLYGFSFGSGISAPLAHRIFASGAMSEFWSQFSADMLLDLADKAITVLLVALALRVLPGRLKSHFAESSWQQAPASEETRAGKDTQPVRKMSIQAKIVLLVAVSSVMIAVAVTAISYFHYRDSAIAENTALADGVASAAVAYIDPDRVDAYLEQGEAAEGYAEIEAQLSALRKTGDDIAYVYVYRVEPDGCHVVFDPDTEDTPGEDPGTVIPFDNAFADYLPALLAGEDIEPVVSDETYGWLLSIYKPVFDRNGVCQCYAAVDIDMSSVAANGYQFLARVISLFLGFVIVVLAAALWLARYNIVLPINRLARAAGQADFMTEEARERSVSSIRQLEIFTGDEIENLFGAITKTTEAMASSITQVERQSETIHKLQDGMILVLADMVESRDQCTGDHVRKTAAYVETILRQLKQEGVYTELLTEEYIRDVISAAPLHDLGKIRVSDGILNKPGRLTEEEFALIKKHTLDGCEIISRVAQTVEGSDSGYLKEAGNLARYHHEKWDGTGYPEGLHGEQIPLSARVMAVADVFDALTSRRSYKEPFSFEKAMTIIQEGSGSHFDAHIVAAFVHAQDRVREILEQKPA